MAATSAGDKCRSSFKKKDTAKRDNPSAPCTKYTASIAIVSGLTSNGD
jgi:hypothetical protein